MPGVEASLKMGKLLPEGPYEVHADDILGHHGGPKKSRTWKGEPLLEGYFFKILGHSPKITKGKHPIYRFPALTTMTEKTVVDSVIATVGTKPYIFLSFHIL